MKLVLCDDQRILCDALATVLEDHGHQVLAVTTTATAGVTAVAAHNPDVFLLDLWFPDAENGLDAARTITQHHPGTKVLVLSGVADPQILSEAIGIGIAGLLPKDQGVDEIADALDAIAAGGAVFDAGLRYGVTSGLPRQRSKDPLDRLTPREKEILARIVGGESTKQMARAMNITNGTASMYVRSVLTKLGVHSRLQAAALVRREGLLSQLGEAWRSAPGHSGLVTQPGGLDVPA
jgi:two-component system, NarL family, nitrate/nitrite response regulator NarL